MPSDSSRGDRITLNVGGELFYSTVSTLTGGSSYFARMFSSEWQEASQSEVFLDRDADSFKVLLSCMRSGHAVLPSDDHTLCKRVLLDAEFFGCDSLLAEVQRVAYEHEHPGEEVEDAASAFSAEHGSIWDALRSGVLPARFFSPQPPEKIKHLIPACRNRPDHVCRYRSRPLCARLRARRAARRQDQGKPSPTHNSSTAVRIS